MHVISVFGAGRSSYYLIRYLRDHAVTGGWEVHICDRDLAAAQEKCEAHPRCLPMALDVSDAADRQAQVQRSTVVVSLLPPALHVLLARDCLQFRKHLLTASYVSSEVAALDEAAAAADLSFLCELGLDPGIDHMTAMERMDALKGEGARILSFCSYTGGLVDPASDDNPWHYKISWNPRNVVLAGQGVATWLEEGVQRFLPYDRLFSNSFTLDYPGDGRYEVYMNRDSMSYRKLYGLQEAHTIRRGTIRRKPFCAAWDALRRTGLTLDSPRFDFSGMTWKQLMQGLLPGSGGLKERLCEFLNRAPDDEVIRNLEWLGILSDAELPIREGSFAEALEHLLLEKWQLKPHDRDMVLMQHEFIYQLQGRQFREIHSLQRSGADSDHTVMAELVGLPLAIATRLLLEGRIRIRGVQIPVRPEIYVPVLEELHGMGIRFSKRMEEWPNP